MAINDRSCIVIFDADFCRFITDNNIEPNIFDEIENIFGFVLTGDKILSELEKYDLGVNYNDKIEQLNENLKIFIERLIDNNIIKTFEDFSDFCEKTEKNLGRGLNCLTQHVSQADIELICISLFIKNRTSYHPIIASNDRDLLFYCNLLSSYFGYVLRIFSIFEIFGYCNKSEELKKYISTKEELKHLSIFNIEDIDGISKNPCKVFKNDLNSVLTKGKLSVHPYGNKIKALIPKRAKNAW